MDRNKLIEILVKTDKECEYLEQRQKYPCEGCKYVTHDRRIHGCIFERYADAIINSRLFGNSPKAMEEQEPHVYKWTAVEDDGYTHSEYGVANNMFDAFIKATEYSPSYHKKVVIEKIPGDELSEELKEFYKDALCRNKFKEQ